MDRPDISIIITTYNVEAYIERALASALSQEGVSLEVIAVDDGSTDRSWQIIANQTDPRVKCIKLNANGGPSVARNAGIAIAAGAWIAVLDGDDTFLPGRLAQCMKLAAEQQADIVVDNLLIHREQDGKQFPMFPPATFAKLQRLDLATFIAGNRLFSGGYSLGYVKPIFSAAFLQKHGLYYDPSIRIGEDYLLLAEALAEGASCAVHPSAGYRYTVRRGSISHRLTLADINRMEEGDAKLLARHRLSPAAMRAQKNREAGISRARAFTMLIDALKRRDAIGAINAILYHPSCLWLLHMPISARLKRLFRKA